MVRSRLLVAALGIVISTFTFAQPNVTRIVVSFAAGGPVDSVGRQLAVELGKELGRTVIVDNKPGANGAIGALDVLRAIPDGNTMWLTSVGAVAINPSLYPNLPYDMQRDFAPVSVIVNNVEVLVVGQNNPAKDTAEFVAATKTRATPTPMASSGIGSIPHLAIEELVGATGAKLLHVPYKGAAPALIDLMGGQVSGFFGDVPAVVTYVKAGQLKALGIASSKRHPSFPDLQTLDEQGIHGVDTNNWYGLFVSAKTPPATVEALNKAVRAALSKPALREKFLLTGTEPAPSTPQELAALLKHDSDKWSKLIKEMSIKAEQ